MSKTYFAGTRPPLSRRLMKIGVAAMLGVAMLQAASPAQAQAQIRPGEIQGTLEVRALGTMENRQGEGKIDFLKRVGRVLDGYTGSTNLEACGVLIDRPHLQPEDQGKWTVPLVTQMSHIACAGVITLPYDGVLSGETIHSHPRPPHGRYQVNQADVSFFYGLHGKRVRRGQRMTLPMYEQARFSQQDFSSGPGWLVENGELLFQNGRDNIQRHGSIHEDPAARLADTPPEPGLPGLVRGQVQMVDPGLFGFPGGTLEGSSLPIAQASRPAP